MSWKASASPKSKLYPLPQPHAGRPRCARRILNAVVFAAIGLGTALTADGQSANFMGALVQPCSGSCALPGLPQGVARDQQGNLWVSTQLGTGLTEVLATNGVLPVPPLTPNVATVASGSFVNAEGLAFDAAGDLWVADEGANAIYEVVAVSGSIPANPTVTSMITTGVSRPWSLAFDASGNLWFADRNNNEIKEALAVSGSVAANPTVNVVASGFNSPEGVWVDKIGNVFVADTQNAVVKEIVGVAPPAAATPPTTPTITTIATGFTFPESVAVDSQGNVWVADNQSGYFSEVVAVNGSIPASPVILPFATWPTSPSGQEPGVVSIDSGGNIFLAESLGSINGIVSELTPSVNFGQTYLGAGDSAQVFATTANATLLFGSTGTSAATFTPAIYTQGSTGLDFAFLSPQAANSCASLGAGGLSPGSVCTVDATFTPLYPGTRLGVVQLNTATGTIAAAPLMGDGVGPMINFGISSNGINSNPSVRTQVAANSFFSNAENIAVDPHHNIYIGDRNGGEIYEATAASGYQTLTPVVEANFPLQMALDGAGDLIWNDYGSAQVLEAVAVNGTLPASPTIVTLASGAQSNHALAIDGQGDVYFADQIGLKEIVAVGGSIPASPTIRLVAANSALPGGSVGVLAFDQHGDMFYAPGGSNVCLYEIAPVNGQIPTAPAPQEVTCGIALAEGLAVDAAGNVWEADAYNGLFEILAVNGVIPASPNTIDRFNGIEGFGLGLDPNGNVFVSFYGSSSFVEEFDFSDTPTFTWSGQTNVGQTAAQTFEAFAENSGNAPLTLEVPSSGTNPSINPNWTWATTATGACPSVSSGAAAAVTLGVGAQCNLTISFSPVDGGTVTGNLTFTDDNLYTVTNTTKQGAGDATQSIILNGDGLGASLPTATLTGIAFGNETEGQQSATMSATLTNTSTTAALSITGITVTGTNAADFTLTTGANACSLTSGVAAGMSCNIYATFTPSTTAAESATLNVMDNAVGSTQTSALTGTGTAVVNTAPTLSSAALAFGDVQINTTSFPLSVEVTANSSSVNLAGSSITGTAAFALTTGANACTTSTTLTAGQSCSFYVTFTPTATTEPYAGTLSIGTTGLSVSLSGQGISFGSKVGTAQAAQSVSVFITTGGTLDSIQVLTQGVSGLDFTLGSGGTCATGTAYTAGETCTVNVGFKPRFPGERFGAVQLYTSAAGSAPIGSTLLSGIGQGPMINFGIEPSPGTFTPTSTNYFTFNAGTNVAVDPNHNLYVNAGDAILEATAASNYQTTNTVVAANSPNSVALDGAGDLIWTDYGTGQILEVAAVNGVIPANPAPVPLGSGWSVPWSSVVDAQGDVFVAQTGNNPGLYEIVAVNGAVSSSSTVQLIENTHPALWMAFDSHGNLFFTGEYQQACIYEIPAVGGQILASTPSQQIVCGFGLPLSIAVDAAGNLWEADFYSGISKVEAVNGVVPASPTIINYSTYAFGLGLDANGNVFWSTYENGNYNTLIEFDFADPPSFTWSGQTNVGTTDSTVYTAYATNEGNQPLILSVPSAGDNPAIDVNWTWATSSAGACPSVAAGGAAASIAAGVQCELPISFAPQNGGSLTGDLTFTDNNLNVAGATQNIGLTGDGVGSAAPTATLTGIAFGSVTQNTTSAAMSATLTNTSTTTAMNISSITITGTNAADFAMTTGTNACGVSLAANTSCLIYATFKPSLAGAESGTLSVADNATGSPQVAALTGTGTAAAPTATLTGIAFGSESEGTTSAAMAATLTNTSTTTAMTISSVTISGTNGDDFSKATGTGACGATLAANTSCKIYVTFTPSLVGAESATLGVNDNATGSPQTAALTGTGTYVKPQATLTPSPVNFGSVTVGSSSSQTVTLTNTGVSNFSISGVSISASSTPFSLNATGTTCTVGMTLPAKATCAYSITFTPAATGAASENLQVEDYADSLNINDTMNGTGTAPLVPAASLSPTTLAFGNQTVNTTSAAMTTTLSNTGTGPLTISSIFLTEPNEEEDVAKGPHASAITISSSPDYSATTTCGSTLAAGATCTISVTFDPSTTGSLPGTLSVYDNAANSPQSASLTGTGYTGGNYTVASPTAPQTVKPGGSAQYTINVSVTPNGDIFNNPVTLTATGLPAGATATFSPVTVTPGTGTATSTMTVRTSSTYALLAPVSGSKWPIPSSLALMFGGAWALFRRKHRERFARLLTLMLLLGAATMGLMGCGAGFAQVQPKTYTITVTGTSGEQTQTTTVTLTVE